MPQDEVTFDAEVRGTLVRVTARDFFEDPDVGIRLGPDALTAVDQVSGKPFDLTEAEEATLGRRATGLYEQRSHTPEDW